MKRLFVALPVLLCIAGVASSQSLADVAKKEKERRKENTKQGKKAVVEAEGAGSSLETQSDPDAAPPAKTPTTKDEGPTASINLEPVRKPRGAEPKEPFRSKTDRTNELVSKLRAIRSSYDDIAWACEGGGYGADEWGNAVSVATPPDMQACAKQKEFDQRYSQLYNELKQVDSYQILIKNIAKVPSKPWR